MSQENKPKGQGMAGVVERNLEALLLRQKSEERKRSTEEAIADKITSFTGSMSFVYLHLALFGIWILWNSKVLGLKPFDPSFVILAMFASVEAIFLSTFVLISQNRSTKQADKRAELELQVNLLAEHEITKLINLVSAIAKKLEISAASDEEIDELSKDVHPEKVMDFIDQSKKNQFGET
jgi:uncharacterized membrane protein